MFEEVHDFGVDGDVGGAADAFEAGVAVDFDDFGAGVGAENVDAGDVEAEDLGGFDGQSLFDFAQDDRADAAAFVEVGAKFTVLGHALHSRDDFFTADESTDVFAFCFGNVFLEFDGATFFFS